MEIKNKKSKAVLLALVAASMPAFGDKYSQHDQLTASYSEALKSKGDGESVNKDFDGGYWLNIAAAGGTTIYSDDPYTYSQNGCVYYDAGGWLEINLRLPDGHRINGIRHYYVDGDTGSSSAQLYVAPSNGGFTPLQTVASTGDSGTYSSLYEAMDTPHIVDNANNAYVIRFTSGGGGSTQEMCGVRLNMTPNP